MGEATLERRFAEGLRRLGLGERPMHLLVALSGGLDSTVLLHLLRFGGSPLPIRVSAAHLDHRMRPSSAADAAWVRGLCAAWEVPLESGSTPIPLHSEESARAERYAFLWAAAARAGADRLLTAHHADDQAETVLFRILRGTGLAGLGGIPRTTRAGLVRPLLDFWRDELEAYAERHGLAWRSDPTNATHGPVRNRIRLRLLPEIEQAIVPRARRNLLALSELARESEAGWRSLLGPILDEIVTPDGAALLVARPQLQGYHPAVQKRLLRQMLRSFGIVPGRLGTRSALQFITDAPSGREMRLPGGVRIRTEFDRVRLERAEASPADVPLVIDALDDDGQISAEIRLGGRSYRVAARFGAAEVGSVPARWRARIPAERLRFPLVVRARKPGDRVATPGGTKSLKKWMIERRVPLGARATIPVLVDAEGTVLWVAGLTSLPTASLAGEERGLDLAIYET